MLLTHMRLHLNAATAAHIIRLVRTALLRILADDQT